MLSKNANDSTEHVLLKKELRRFAQDRDWDKFHSPKNLSMALSVEVSELLEVFQWLSCENSNNLNELQHSRVSEELADIFLYLLRITDKLNINLIQEAHSKLERNAEKYPINKSYGNATKYSDFE